MSSLVDLVEKFEFEVRNVDYANRNVGGLEKESYESFSANRGESLLTRCLEY